MRRASKIVQIRSFSSRIVNCFSGHFQVDPCLFHTCSSFSFYVATKIHLNLLKFHQISLKVLPLFVLSCQFPNYGQVVVEAPTFIWVIGCEASVDAAKSLSLESTARSYLLFDVKTFHECQLWSSRERSEWIFFILVDAAIAEISYFEVVWKYLKYFYFSKLPAISIIHIWGGWKLFFISESTDIGSK